MIGVIIMHASKIMHAMIKNKYGYVNEVSFPKIYYVHINGSASGINK